MSIELLQTETRLTVAYHNGPWWRKQQPINNQCCVRCNITHLAQLSPLSDTQLLACWWVRSGSSVLASIMIVHRSRINRLDVSARSIFRSPAIFKREALGAKLYSITHSLCTAAAFMSCPWPLPFPSPVSISSPHHLIITTTSSLPSLLFNLMPPLP